MGLSLVACQVSDGQASDTDGGTESTAESDPTSATGGVDPSHGESTGESTGTEPTGDPGGDDDQEHALGTIVLSESHAATGGTASGMVSILFVPDASAEDGCFQSLGGCRIAVVPDCQGTCDAGEYCAFDESCEATCIEVCDADCDADEVCYFASPDNAACRPQEEFDGGTISFIGTTTPITVLPPYANDGFEEGAPFAPRTEISVHGSGALEAGFEAFEESFATTSFVRTSLDDITLAEAYGEDDLRIEWTPDTEAITVNVTATSFDGAYGTVTCSAEDAAGSLAVPRAAIAAAIDGETASGIAVSVTRTRTEVAKGIPTKGALQHANVQDIGWLALTTSSTESHTIEGCGFGELVCGDECTNVLDDTENCGGCGVPCSSFCTDGECWSEDDDDACSDGFDNDNDGYYDCEDFDCSMNPQVSVCDTEDSNSACMDGLDNDGDGYYDCEDFGCSMNPDVTVC